VVKSGVSISTSVSWYNELQFVCLFVCLFIVNLNLSDCVHISSNKKQLFQEKIQGKKIFQTKNLFLINSCIFLQSKQNNETLTIFAQSIGEGMEQIPIWQISNQKYQGWVQGRVLVKLETDYKVGGIFSILLK
jgi:hypothetical protein